MKLDKLTKTKFSTVNPTEHCTYFETLEWTLRTKPCLHAEGDVGVSSHCHKGEAVCLFWREEGFQPNVTQHQGL